MDNFKNLLMVGILGITSLILNCKGRSVEIENNFVNLYVDLRLATLGNTNDPQRAWKTRQIIFDKYGTSKKAFSEKVKKIQENPEIWEEFQIKVIARIDSAETMHKGE